MRRKGYIFTMDAALAFIPIFIILASVTNLGEIDTFGTNRQLNLQRYGQDTMEWFSAEPPPLVGENSSLEQYLLDGNKSPMDIYFQDSIGEKNALVYVNCSNTGTWEFVTAYVDGSVIGEPGANMSMTAANDLVAAERTLSNHSTSSDAAGIRDMCTFRIYVWE